MSLKTTLSSQERPRIHLRLIPARADVTQESVAFPYPSLQRDRTTLSVSKGRAPRLLDQVRHAIRARHYSYRTEKAYVSWIKRFIFFHKKCHPREMGEAEIG